MNQLPKRIFLKISSYIRNQEVFFVSALKALRYVLVYAPLIAAMITEERLMKEHRLERRKTWLASTEVSSPISSSSSIVASCKTCTKSPCS